MNASPHASGRPAMRPAGEAPRPRPRTADIPPRAAPGSAGTALLVDDDPQVRQTIGRMLEYLGYVVLQAEDTAGALAAPSGQPLVLMVVDVILERETGLEVVAALEPQYGDVPVLYISGFAGDVFERRGLDPDALGILSKPFGLRELGAAVEQSVQPDRP